MANKILSSIHQLKRALNLSMSLHRAIIRQGTSIIDKQDIRTFRGHRVVVLTQGPDLALFAHPGVLSRLRALLPRRRFSLRVRKGRSAHRDPRPAKHDVRSPKREKAPNPSEAPEPYARSAPSASDPRTRPQGR